MTAQSTQPMADHRPAAAAALAASLVFAVGIAFGAVAGLNVHPAAAPAPVSITWSGTNPDAVSAPAPAAIPWAGTNPDAKNSDSNLVHPTIPYFNRIRDFRGNHTPVQRLRHRTDGPTVVATPKLRPR